MTSLYILIYLLESISIDLMKNFLSQILQILPLSGPFDLPDLFSSGYPAQGKILDFWVHFLQFE